MAEHGPASTEGHLAKGWRALQGSAAQAHARIATGAAGAPDLAGTGEVRELRRAAEALHRALRSLAERATSTERQVAAPRTEQRGHRG